MSTNEKTVIEKIERELGIKIINTPDGYVPYNIVYTERELKLLRKYIDIHLRQAGVIE